MFLIACGPDGNKPHENAAWTAGFFKRLSEWRWPRIHGYDAHFYTWNMRIEDVQAVVGLATDYTGEQGYQLIADSLVKSCEISTTRSRLFPLRLILDAILHSRTTTTRLLERNRKCGMNALRLFPKMVIAIGIAFAIAGLVAAGAGIYIRTFVGRQLTAQQIVTPEDATIPNTPVTGIATSLSMANIIQHHAADSGNGLTYAQMGRFAVASGDPAGTNNADEAVKDANGKPAANQARNTQLTAAGLVTALSLSAMALGASYAAIALGVGFTALGIIIAGLGYALLGLITPAVAQRFGLQTVAA